MNSAVYLIQSIRFPNRQYVGSAVKPRQRWQNHISDLIRNNHCNPKLQNHINKYGIEDLTFSILEVCYAEQLIQIEQLYIDSLHPWFNLCPVAGSRLGAKCSARTKIKMRHSAKRAVRHRKRNFRNQKFVKLGL